MLTQNLDNQPITLMVLKSLFSDFKTEIINEISKKIDKKVDEKINEVMEIVIFIKDNAVSKDEFNEFRDEMYQFKNTTEQSFFSLQSEVNSLQGQIQRTNQRVQKVSNQSIEDTTANSVFGLGLEKRLTKVEKSKKIQLFSTL